VSVNQEKRKQTDFPGPERGALDESQIYQIRVKGHINAGWSEWFCDLSVRLEEDGTTLLTGPVADQPALHGILARIRDLGMHLLSVRQLETDNSDCRTRTNAD
jgi:hypothetical protein